ncbi:MAG: CoA transferase [Actinomycetota bacterium]|nr:CoA transferase [Actinomycetota bacterium]
MGRTTSVTGPPLAVDTCERRLSTVASGDRGTGGEGEPRDTGEAGVDCRVSWYGPAGLPPGRLGSEAAVQALCGLMHVHGRDAGRPRRIGLDIASTAAGLLAAQGVLAARIARRRGRPMGLVETSVLQAGLLLVSHYVAIATCPDGPPAVPAWPSPGPPFRSADGHWFEMETLDPGAWRAFWSTLGAAGPELGPAWTVFRLRYNRGACTLPHHLHEATARHTLARVAEVAEACGVSLSRLRGYGEVLGDAARPEVNPDIRAFAAGPPAVPGRPRPVPPPAAEAAAQLPLEGLRVVEATNRVQGPLAGLLMMMLGAEVVLVEPPGGDPSRSGLPQVGDTGAFFLCFNRGKQTVELDLNRPSGRSDLKELAAGADVFLHNWRPGKSTEWGLAAEDLAGHNPRLVYASASGWGGLPGPSRLVGTDFMVQAYAGVGNGIHPEDEPPFPSRLLIADYIGGLLACEGILAGLDRRERTGVGCQVSTSLLGAAMTVQAPVLEALAASRENGRRGGRPVWSVLDRPVQTADASMAVSVEDGPGLARLARVFGVDMGTDRAATEQALVERMGAHPAARCEELAAEAGVACAVVCADPGQLPSQPRLTPLFEPLGPDACAPASPWRFS